MPLRRVELELISSTAASMATLATLPMVELTEKTAPSFTTGGLVLNPLEMKQRERSKRTNLLAIFTNASYCMSLNKNEEEEEEEH